MILVDRQIKEVIAPHVGSFNEDCINTCSLDVRWSGRYRLPIPPQDDNPFTYDDRWSDTVTAHKLIINQGDFVLLDTLEYIALPIDVSAQLMLKSTLARAGLDHTLAGWIDAGFSGTITLEMTNNHPFPIGIEVGQRIAQLVFHKHMRPENPYHKIGRYNGQSAPEPSR